LIKDNPADSLENQLALQKFHLEKKYASMLQQVLVQKRLVRTEGRKKRSKEGREEGRKEERNEGRKKGGGREGGKRELGI